MTSISGAKSPKDDTSDHSSDDGEADDSFATAADAWAEEAHRLDQQRPIVDVEDHDELEEESRDIDGENAVYHDNDSLDQDQEDDTLPSLDEELQAQQRSGDSSIFQGPSPQVNSPLVDI